jgi:hypothetical protein
LEECECFRGNILTGRTDYFIKIFGQWIPVEAKLDISREKDLFAQVAKYMNINYFLPKKGYQRNKTFNVKTIPMCLVFDQNGLYFISSTKEFINSCFEKPRWKRKQFSQLTALKIRQEVKTYLYEI